MAVTMNDAVFWNVTPCGSYRNRSVRGLLVTANVISSSPILLILMMEALRFPEASLPRKPYGVRSQKTASFKLS
jgi:hypothetical protein